MPLVWVIGCVADGLAVLCDSGRMDLVVLILVTEDQMVVRMIGRVVDDPI